MDASFKQKMDNIIKKLNTSKTRIWLVRVLALVIVTVLSFMAWPAFFEEEWVDPSGVGDYLPMRLRQGDYFVQPFTPEREGFSEIRLSFDPPVRIEQPDELRMTLSVLHPDRQEAAFTVELSGTDIHPYSSTVIPVSFSDYDPGEVLEFHLTMDQIQEEQLLSVHTINVSQNRLVANGERKGVAIAMILTYTRFNTGGLLAAIGLLLAVAALLFMPLQAAKKVFARYPLLPMLMAPALQLLILELLNTLNTDIMLPGVLIVLSYLVLLLVQVLITALVKNDRLSFYLSGILVSGLGIANHMKQFFRGDPFYAGDIISVRMVMESVNQLSYDVSVRFLLAVFVMMIYLILFFHARRQSLISFWPLRVGFSTGAVILLLLFSNYIILNDTLMITQFNVSRYPWNQMMNYGQNGFVVPFVNSVRDVFIPQPRVPEPIAEDFYLVPQQRMEPKPESPNIIVVMNESYTDFNNIQPINTSEPVMPYFDELRRDSRTRSGYVLTPVFGGGTCNTEFEYLMGGSMLFFHDSSVPYLSYFRRPVHSIADLLSQQGYKNIAIHSYIRSFWNRQTVYPAMGFDKFISLEDFPEYDPLPNFVSDQVHYEQIVEQMQQKDEDERLFIFNVTMQNHFPYYSTEESHSKLNYHIKLPEFADAESVELYLSMLRESDDALRYLVSYLETLDEPTLLLFFGDHLPGNNNYFDSFYESLFGKTIADLDLHEMRKLYETPYLFWANYDLPDLRLEPLPDDDEPLTSPNFLGLMTLELAGVDQSPYFEYVDTVNETVKAMSTTMLVMNNGRIYDRDSIPQSIVRQLDRYRAYQYDNVIKPLEP